MLPTDLVHVKIPSKRLLTPLNTIPPANDPDVEAFVLDEIMELIKKSEEDVIILVDACAIRHHVKEELKDLLTKTQFPVFAAPMGKTAVPETYERYGGVSDISSNLPRIPANISSYRSMSAPSVDLRSGNELRTPNSSSRLVVSRVTSTLVTSLTTSHPPKLSRYVNQTSIFNRRLIIFPLVAL